MSDFLVSLWESVFTPGPTPTLLRATNATFGTLQALLFVLLLSTHSYHFVILSVLSGGLWWAINWFSAEVLAAKEQEAARSGGGGGGGAAGKDSRNDQSSGETRKKNAEQVGSDTETEVDEKNPPREQAVVASGAHTARTGPESKAERRKQPLSSNPARPGQSIPQPTAALSSSLEPRVSSSSSLQDSGLLKATRSVGDSSGYVSTDSEWEKVSENGGS